MKGCLLSFLGTKSPTAWMNRLLVTQTHFHQVGPYKSLHVVPWSVGPALCHRSVSGALSLWFGHIQLGPYVIIAPGLTSAHCYVDGERGSASPEPAECVTTNKCICVWWGFFLSFAVSKLRGSLHSKESYLEAKNLNKQPQLTWKAMELAAAKKILKGSLAL